jgi:hypothetical protein
VQRLAHDLERSSSRAPSAADELHPDAAPRHLLRDLRAGAVHDAHFVALLNETEDAARTLRGNRTADFDDETRHDR